MTHADFCAWLSGYLVDREKPDAALILQKLGEVVPPAPVLPVYPLGAPNPLYPDTNKWTSADRANIRRAPASGDPMPIRSYGIIGAANAPGAAHLKIEDGTTVMAGNGQPAADLASVFASLAAGQTRLGADFEAAWSDNADTLYQA